MIYVAFYDKNEFLYEKRSCTPAAINVVGYIADIFSECCNVKIISPSRTLCTGGFFKGRESVITEKVKLIQPPSIGVKSAIGKKLILIYTQLWLFFMLFQNVSRNEQIVVYHSLFTMPAIRLIKKIKKLKIILEIRELYGDVTGNEKLKDAEIDFASIANKYIFPTQYLSKIVNPQGKEELIIIGNYYKNKLQINKFNDGKIHVVYAGTFDINKGINDAISVGSALPENYHVHILGYGTKQEETRVQKDVERAQQIAKAAITYDGLLMGEELSAFLKKCDVGLASQNIGCALNDSSFPSKILTYIASDLAVVSARIPVVEKSCLGRYITYYDKSEPFQIAQAVIEAYSSKKQYDFDILDKLDQELRSNIKCFYEVSSNE